MDVDHSLSCPHPHVFQLTTILLFYWEDNSQCLSIACPRSKPFGPQTRETGGDNHDEDHGKGEQPVLVGRAADDVQHERCGECQERQSQPARRLDHVRKNISRGAP